MTLRKKTILIVGLSVTALIVILNLTVSTLLLKGFKDLEQNQVKQDVQRVVLSYSQILAELDSKILDWSQWDDTYLFIENPNRQYIQSNLVDETFTISRFNFTLFFNTRGQLIFGKGFDLKAKKEIPLPPSLMALLGPTSSLLRHSSVRSVQKGLVMLPEGPLLLVSRPIIHSDETGPVRGALVFGRFFNEDVIQNLSRITQFSLAVFPFEDPKVPSEVFEARSTALLGPWVKPLDEQSITGYATLNDIFGKPALTLRLVTSRSILEQGRKSLHYLTLSLLLVGVFFLGLTLLPLEKMVLRRLARLSEEVSEVSKKQDLTYRMEVVGNDEISRLSENLNQMLGILEHSQKALIDQAEALQHSNEELKRFAYVASHDLQEPLRMVSLYAQLIRQRYQDKLDPDAEQFIGYLTDGASRMQNLIHDLLEYSRILGKEAGFQKIDLHQILQEGLRNLKLSIEESHVQITWDPLPPIKGIRHQLIQLFQNLISNAIKFKGPSPLTIHISGKAREKDWLFSVKDNGIGIEPQYTERIFAVFQRIHHRSTYPGTGMGLAICKKIVERHGGRIWVESTLGKGSEFFFTLSKEQHENQTETEKSASKKTA